MSCTDRIIISDSSAAINSLRCVSGIDLLIQHQQECHIRGRRGEEKMIRRGHREQRLWVKTTWDWFFDFLYDYKIASCQRYFSQLIDFKKVRQNWWNLQVEDVTAHHMRKIFFAGDNFPIVDINSKHNIEKNSTFSQQKCLHFNEYHLHRKKSLFRAKAVIKRYHETSKCIYPTIHFIKPCRRGQLRLSIKFIKLIRQENKKNHVMDKWVFKSLLCKKLSMFAHSYLPSKALLLVLMMNADTPASRVPTMMLPTASGMWFDDI